MDTTRWNFNGPTDSTSIVYGNGYDTCGPYTYTIEDIYGDETDIPELRYEVNPVTNNMDTFELTLETLLNGDEVQVPLKLRIKLTNFPFSTDAVFDFTAIYKACTPTNFVAQPLADRTYLVTQNMEWSELIFD